MKTKNLALTNGIVGLVGGIILLFGGWFIAGGVLNDAATGSVSSTSGTAAFLNILKIAILALGIIALIYYKGDKRVGTAADVLLIVGGAIALIPFLGWIGGILAIIGGSLYLASLKHFSQPQA
ncbi:hypothetical protein JMO19_03915 [Lactiplantibacillus plantarum]|uniref:hypothetical protein n=1 Tax=Lactiplantibacillus plantarum TaxID=1590 RepID=UPI00192DE7A5|nr:hypothetical protein [Lactiplantibacillus plantarum]QRA40298.1 hypothetical protein JMO19_03915 [Lactiplantibacillus plantarum]